LVGSPLQIGRGGEVFSFFRFFKSCWFEDVGPRGFLEDPKEKSISRGEKQRMEAEASGHRFSGASGSNNDGTKPSKECKAAVF
jgi:hypothetical protein